jgi:hypothetical protein
MAAETEKIVCKFIGDFKVGDNLVRNAEALCQLSDTNENGVFNKLMVIQAGRVRARRSGRAHRWPPYTGPRAA